ncbi:MAG: 2-hydroxyacyl-CoA dehydratase family protein [Euryarchaeota archaeon]|nr:2-hydroxyacyl-CoA dehydratase family protein [Euryarchaeota archaeon]MCG2736228.1 2-hydroxyacyl-CoA dehydratase family protein [Candidatus Methanoperedenaceae archaeon]
MALDTLKKIEEAVKERPQELAEARKNGAKVVGWFNYNIPEEIIHALGLIPIRLGIGGDDRLVEIGARYISTKNCVFTREIVGLFAENQDPYIKNSDLVAVDATCLQTYRVAELIKYYFKVNTLILGVPRNFYLPEGQEYFWKELESFTQKLEEFAGNKLDKNKLAESIKLYNGIRKALKDLYKYQATDSPSIKWREVFDAVHAGFYLDRDKYLSLLQELLKELKEEHGEPVIKNLNGDARILLSGSIIPPKDTKLIDIIEQVGGRIVGDELWSGLNPSLNVNIKEPSVKGIADAYINRVPHAALPYLDLETDGRLKNLKQLIKDYKAQGVIYHTLRYCDPFTFKAGETKDVLKNEGVPLLEIHTEYAGSDVEAIRTRAEAFVELIKNKNILEATL